MAAELIAMKVFWRKQRSVSCRPLPGDEGATFKVLMTFTWPEFGLTVFYVPFSLHICSREGSNS
jgi:hypothetical protein